MIENNGNLGLHRLWLTPFDPKVLGGLRGKMNQFADSSSTIITPKRRPIIKRSPDGHIQSSNIEQDSCVIPNILSLEIDPDGPYVIDVPPGTGPTLTISATVTGTTPITYQWVWNGIVIGNESTLEKTLIISDAIGATEENGWEGASVLILNISNACGSNSIYQSISMTLNFIEEP